MGASKKKIGPKEADRGQVIPLTAFHDRKSPTFSFGRWNWKAAGQNRESLVPLFEAKQWPPDGKAGGSPAAAVSLLLPADAGQDYFDVDFMVRRYEETLPAEETIALAQLTMRFPEAPSLHHPFEVVREWAGTYFRAEGLPAVVILHNPALVGSGNAGHVHVLVIPRRLNRLGWGTMARDIANDASRLSAWKSWEAYRREAHGV